MDTHHQKSEHSNSIKTPVPREKPESIRGNPYFIYVILTGVLFLFLVVMGYVAWKSDWLPHRSSQGNQVEVQ